jgi:DNA-binding CsgD family transcriptional regulator
MLVYGNGELWLRDLGSSNGTFVNGERVTCAKITAGTFLQLGRVGLDLVDRLPEERAVAGSAIETDRESADQEAEEALQRVHFPPKRDQVARLLLQGLTEKQVAARVHRSKHTVHWHVTRIYRQVHVRSRAAFAAFFTRLRRRQKPGR